MCHAKTNKGANGQMPETPIGRGGKVDDTSVVVAEVVQWTEEHERSWSPSRRRRWGFENMYLCGGNACSVDGYDADGRIDYDDDEMTPANQRQRKLARSNSQNSQEEDEEHSCSIS